LSYSSLSIGLLSDASYAPTEKRTALTPDSVAKLTGLGFTIFVETKAGMPNGAISFPDAAYTAAGATVLPTATAVIEASNIITKIRPPSPALAPLFKSKTLISTVPFTDHDEYLPHFTGEGQNSTIFALDSNPRMLSRAQVSQDPGQTSPNASCVPS